MAQFARRPIFALRATDGVAGPLLEGRRRSRPLRRNQHEVSEQFEEFMIDWPQQLVDDLARRRAIVMIGSGVSRHSVGLSGARPPTWHGFLRCGTQPMRPQPAIFERQ